MKIEIVANNETRKIEVTISDTSEGGTYPSEIMGVMEVAKLQVFQYVNTSTEEPTE